MQNILTEGIYNFLIDNIGEEVSNRIYEFVTPDNVVLPCVVYTIVSDVPSFRTCADTFDEPFDALIQIDFLGDSQLGSAALRTISDLLYINMNRTNNLELNSVDNIQVLNRDRGLLDVVAEVMSIRTEYSIQGFPFSS